MIHSCNIFLIMLIKHSFGCSNAKNAFYKENMADSTKPSDRVSPKHYYTQKWQKEWLNCQQMISLVINPFQPKGSRESGRTDACSRPSNCCSEVLNMLIVSIAEVFSSFSMEHCSSKHWFSASKVFIRELNSVNLSDTICNSSSNLATLLSKSSTPCFFFCHHFDAISDWSRL
jgi:hypothetical protein